MTSPLRLFVLAGEHSGDRLGGDLVKRIKQRRAVEVIGVGAHELSAHGLNSIYPMDDLSVMGFGGVLKRLPLLLWRIEQTARAVLAAKPDLVVLIDAQVFSQRLATRLRKANYGGPIILYVSPTVWGRAPERARKLKPLFDEVLAVLPFEPGVMQRLGGPPTSYVGHPALLEAQPPPDPAKADLVALLPGSRAGEISRHVPLLREAATELAQLPEISGFFLPALPAFAERMSALTSDWPIPVRIVTDRTERLALYHRTRLAVTDAGTVTLELALAGVPMVVTHVMDRPQAHMYKVLNYPRVSLPSIILGEDLVPEIVQLKPDAAPLVAAALDIASDTGKRAVQIAAFQRVRHMMESGLPDAPRQDPADRVLSHLRTN
jgi:lipid-A-disaccharide synthase